MDELLKLGLFALFAGMGGFIGAYLKRKGENLATHEDINQLVQQVRAVTTATKEIEAKISSEVWDKQKQWELKRDALFEVTKRIASVSDALFNMNITHFSPVVKGQELELTSRQVEASRKSWEAESSFDQATLLVNLVCGEEVNTLLRKFAETMRRSAKEISKRESTATESLKELRAQAASVTVAMRKEIGIDKHS